MLQQIKSLISLLRIKQWVKNIFVFAPLIFANKFLIASAWCTTLNIFLVFCLASSSGYVLNDLVDRVKDRAHPTKCKRPLASGALSVTTAYISLAILYLCLLLEIMIVKQAMWVILSYIILNYAYSFKLKEVPILDIFIISIGFVLRVLVGSIAIHVPLSPWMAITMFALALFLAATKREQEFLLLKGHTTRDVLKHYTQDLLRKFTEISAICAIMFYSIFALVVNQIMAFTIPFVIYGIFRYWFIVERKQMGESPTDALLHDGQLLTVVVLWGLLVLFIFFPIASMAT